MDGICSAISRDKLPELSHYCFPQHTLRAKYHWFFFFVALSRYVAQWFSDGSFCPHYYLYYFYFYIPPLHFYYKVFAFQSIFGFYIDHISLYWNFEMTVSINGYVTCSQSPIIISGLLLGMFLSVLACWFRNMFNLFSWIIYTDFVTC